MVIYLLKQVDIRTNAEDGNEKKIFFFSVVVVLWFLVHNNAASMFSNVVSNLSSTFYQFSSIWVYCFNMRIIAFIFVLVRSMVGLVDVWCQGLFEGSLESQNSNLFIYFLMLLSVSYNKSPQLMKTYTIIAHFQLIDNFWERYKHFNDKIVI